MIPKQIWITCKDKNDLHEDFKNNIEIIRNFNKDHNLTIIDNDDFEIYIKNKDTKLHSYYKKLNKDAGALIGDFVRYVLMYYEGGIYLDMKSGTKRPLNTLISNQDEIIFYNWDNYNQLVQFFLASKPYHDFYKYLLDELCKNIDNYKPQFKSNKSNVLRLSGPIFITKCFDSFYTDECIKPVVRSFKSTKDLIYCRVKNHSSKMDNSYSNCKTHLIN